MLGSNEQEAAAAGMLQQRKGERRLVEWGWLGRVAETLRWLQPLRLWAVGSWRGRRAWLG